VASIMWAGGREGGGGGGGGGFVYPTPGAERVGVDRSFQTKSVLCLIINQIRTSSTICGMRVICFSNSGVAKVHYDTIYLEY
jgi:hypothetical protein